ncbi:MAG: PspC domain-containing protein [Elusimicrobiota bacterium]|jgi:phage shock protein PspC (stress-responsive transcriptional regulator)|nr:PspC domain-containing protein [Elusimicrobiota bacterium]
MKKRLYKSDSKMLCGVCGGIAEYLDLDPTLVRLAWAFLTLFTCAFPGIILYVAAAIIMPKKPI